MNQLLFAVLWLPLALYAVKSILLFGPSESGTDDIVRILAGRQDVDAYERYPVNEHFQVITIEHYDTTADLQQKLKEHNIDECTVDLILMAEDAVNEASRIMRTEQALHCYFPSSKVLGLVTRGDEDFFFCSDAKLACFKQRKITALAVGIDSREHIIYEIMSIIGGETKPLSAPFMTVDFDELIHEVAAWERTYIRLGNNIQVLNSDFVLEDQGLEFDQYRHQNDRILVDSTNKLALRINEGLCYIRQEQASKINVLSDLPCYCTGKYTNVHATCPHLTVMKNVIETLSSSHVRIASDTIVKIGAIDCHELDVVGKLELGSFTISEKLAVSGSLVTEETINVPILTFSGHINSKGIEARILTNEGTLVVKEKIRAGRFQGSLSSVVSAPSMEVTGESNINVPDPLMLPQKFYLAIGNAVSGKSAAGLIFGSQSEFLDDTKWLDDKLIMHFHNEVAILEVNAHDAHFWLPQASLQTTLTGIKQVLARYGRSHVDGVLIFESLDGDYSGTKRTIEQARSVLEAFGSGLDLMSTMVIYAGQNHAMLGEARKTLAFEGDYRSCLFDEALEYVHGLQVLNLNIPPSPSLNFDVPSYYQVGHSQGADNFDACLMNRGYLNLSSLKSNAIQNSGLLIVDSEFAAENVVNCGIMKLKSYPLAKIHNHGSLAVSNLQISYLNNSGTVTATLVHGVEESRLINSGSIFALRTISPLSYLENDGKISMKSIEALKAMNYGELNFTSATFTDYEALSGETRIPALTVKNILRSEAFIKSDTIETFKFIPSETSRIEADKFTCQNACTVKGSFDVNLATITGDLTIQSAAHIKELSCTGTVDFKHPDARVGSVSCHHATGCGLIRSISFSAPGQIIEIPESTAPLRIKVKGRGSTLILSGKHLVDVLQTASDTKVIVRGDTTLNLSNDLFLADLRVEGNLTLKGAASIYTGSIFVSPETRLIIEGSVVVSERLSAIDSLCNVQGEVLCHDFGVEGSRVSIEGVVRTRNEIEIMSPSTVISGAIQAGSNWRIESDSLTIRRLPNGQGLVRSDHLIVTGEIENHEASIIIDESYTGPAIKRLELLEYHGVNALLLESIQLKALVVSRAPLTLAGAGLIEGIDAAQVPIRLDGDYTCMQVVCQDLDLKGSLTLRGEGLLAVGSTLRLDGKLFAQDSRISALKMSSSGLCLVKSLLVDELGDFTANSHTTARGLQSTLTRSWSPLGVIDISYIDLPVVERFSPHLLYTSVVRAPECHFAPQEKGLVAIMPDAHHPESFVFCKDYVLPTNALHSDKVSDVVFHRLFGRWPEEHPVSIRQTKYDSATTLRLADTIVKASSTKFPSDLSWDGTFQLTTGSDLSVERFCKWQGDSLRLRAPNLTVRGKLELSADLFADIENQILIEKCQDKWIERVVEKTRKRTLCFSSSKRSVRTFNMARSDADGGVVSVGGNVGLRTRQLEVNAGQVLAGGDLEAKAESFIGRANIDTSYEMDNAKGGNFWGGRRDHYSRMTQDVHAPTLASGGKKRVEFGKMDVEAAQMVSRDDLVGHVTGDATLRSVKSTIEGKRSIKSSGFGVTSCTQETVSKVTPSTYASTDGDAGLKVDGHLQSEGTTWMAKTAIEIEAGSADFPAAYAELRRTTEFSGMQDPLSYTEGYVNERMRQAMPNRFVTTDEGGTHVRVHTARNLDGEAPLFDADKVNLKSDTESINIKKATNTFESESETFTASINFFGSDALRAAAQGEKGWGLKLLDEVPLLGALKGMAQARGNQSLLCAGINTAIATVGTMKELASCGGLGDYMISRLCRVELAVSLTQEEQRVLQEVGMNMVRPNSSLSMEARKDVCVGGLSGQLDSLFVKGSTVKIDPLRSESWFSSDTVSMGVSFNFATMTPGASFGLGGSSGHSVGYQSAPLSVRSLGIQATEEVEVGTFIKAVSTFIETKKMVLKSYKSQSKSKNWNASVSIGLPSEKAGSDGKGSFGGSFGYGSSNIEELNLGGIESDTMHVKSPNGIELHGAVLRLTGSARAVQGDDGSAWYEFALPESLDELLAGGMESGEVAVQVVRGWAEAKGNSVQLWTRDNETLRRTELITVAESESTVNICIHANTEGPPALHLLNIKPGIIETSYIKSFDMKTKHRESYVGIGISDIMSCASCAGYMSIDYRDLRKTARNHAMASAGLDFGPASLRGDKLARTEFDRVWSHTSRDVNISIKALPIITDFAEYFEFMRKPTGLLKEIRDAIWGLFEAELEEELTGEATYDGVNREEIDMTDEQIDEMLEKALQDSERILKEEKEKARREAKSEKDEDGKAKPAESKQTSDDGTKAREENEPSSKRPKVQEDEVNNEDGPNASDFNYMDILNARMAQAEEGGVNQFINFNMARKLDEDSSLRGDDSRRGADYKNKETEDGYYKNTVMGLLWLAEGSESSLRFMDAAKSKYSLVRLLMKATPAKIFVDIVGKEISKTVLRHATKETVVRAMSEAIFLTIADPDLPLGEQKALSKRVHNAATIMYDWYALVMTSKGLKEDLKDFGGDVKKLGKKSWKAIKKSGALHWFKAKFSGDELIKKSEAVMDIMIKRANMDLKAFEKNPKAFLKKYQEQFYDRTVGYTPMAETIFKGSKNFYTNHGAKIGEAIDITH